MREIEVCKDQSAVLAQSNCSRNLRPKDLPNTTQLSKPVKEAEAYGARSLGCNEGDTLEANQFFPNGLLGLVFTVVCCGINSVAHSQQTIFNVPSTDVLDKGKVYAELDASLKPTDGSSITDFSTFVPRVVVGAGNRFEIGLNLTGNIQPGPDSTTLVPTIKWKPYQGENNGWAFVVGDSLFVPVRNRAYDAGNYVYVEASKTFKSGTRFTFGGYDFTRNVVSLANRAGGQFGIEQPLNRKITFAADWLTGKHAAGYFTPGVVFKVGPRVTGYAGYSLGNTGVSTGNHFFLLELGYNFN
jgi:hypothetical protein